MDRIVGYECRNRIFIFRFRRRRCSHRLYQSSLPLHSLQSLQASGGGNTIDCVYRNSWPSTLTPAQACTALNDPTHPVPYKCATSGQRLCCTVSNLTTATFGSFGKCTKVGAAVPTTPTPPTPKPPTRKPTRKPTKKPAISSNISAPTKKPASSPTTPAGTNNIDCAWYSYFKDYTPVAACKKLNDPTHPVPYVCADGRKVCCTVSSYLNTTMANFGKCTKV